MIIIKDNEKYYIEEKHNRFSFQTSKDVACYLYGIGIGIEHVAYLMDSTSIKEILKIYNELKGAKNE